MLRVVGNRAVEDEADGRSLLDEIPREGARRMLVAALETEVAAYLEAHREERDEDGHALVVRNGKGRTRKITVGAGTIPVSAPRVNDRWTDQDGERRRFTSRILPPYMRRSPKVAEILVVVGDGALGFWAAVRDVWPKTRAQRDWFHYADHRIMPSSPRGASSTRTWC